jgi:hypothetical protein
MKVSLSLNDIKPIKNQLIRQLPQVKASHRVEAMARGLGWNTHASLLAELSIQPIECVIDNTAFIGYLEQHNITVNRQDFLEEAVVQYKFYRERNAIKTVMVKEPNLTHFGFEIGSDPQRPRSAEEHEERFRQNREAMLSPQAIGEFMRSIEFLSLAEKRPRINKTSSSYGLKHQAERLHRDRAIEYISNGMLIAAAIHLGFDTRRDGPNAYFNIIFPEQKRRKTRSQLAGCVGGETRRTAWRNMMVAAINAGLDQSIFGLDENDNRWVGENHIYRFSFADLPAIASVSDIGFGELSIKVAIQPAREAEKYIQSSNAGFYAGDAFASGWLERKDGKWLQEQGNPINAFRRSILPIIAQTTIQPKGYKNTGKFQM